MMWLTLAVLSSVFSSFKRIYEKPLSVELSPFVLGWSLQFYSLPLMVIFLLAKGHLLNPLTLSLQFWIPLLVIWLILYPVQTYSYYRSIKEGELSRVLPVLALIPVLNIFTSWVLLREVPSVYGLIGIGFIVLGVYSLNISGLKLHNPLRPFYKEKTSLLMLITAFGIALGTALDKVAIQVSDPYYYSVANTLGAAVSLYIISRLLKNKDNKSVNKNYRLLFVVGAIQGVSFIAFTLALTLGPVAYIMAIKSSHVIIGSILGILILNEVITKQKIACFTIIGLGFIFLALT